MEIDLTRNKTLIAHFEGWHTAVGLALQSKSGIFLEHMVGIKKGDELKLTEGSLRVMTKS